MGFDRRAYRSLATKEIKNIRNYFDGCHDGTYNHCNKNNDVSWGKKSSNFRAFKVYDSYFYNMGFFIVLHSIPYCLST